MHDMISTIRQFRWHILTFLFLVLLHCLIPTPARGGEASALPVDVQKAIAKTDADCEAIQAKAEGEKFKARKALLAVLTKAQEKATKTGNLDAANAINAKVKELEKLTEVPDLLTKAPAAPVKDRLAGSFAYDFSNGHKGVLQVRKGDATIPGFQGIVSTEGTAAIITWSNGTKWSVADQAGELVVTASDGTCKLTPQ